MLHQLKHLLRPKYSLIMGYSSYKTKPEIQVCRISKTFDWFIFCQASASKHNNKKPPKNNTIDKGLPPSSWFYCYGCCKCIFKSHMVSKGLHSIKKSRAIHLQVPQLLHRPQVQRFAGYVQHREPLNGTRMQRSLLFTALTQLWRGRDNCTVCHHLAALLNDGVPHGNAFRKLP